MRATVIMIDALRHDYLNPEDSPFLWSLRERSLRCRRLTPAHGFGQRTTLFTGAAPNVHGVLTMFKFSARESPFHDLNRVCPEFRHYQQLNRLASIRGLWRFGPLWRQVRNRRRQLEQAAAKRIAAICAEQKLHFPLIRIPLELLPHLALAEDRVPIQEPGGCAVPSLFDVLRAGGIPFAYIMYPVVNCNDDEALRLAVDAGKRGAEVIFLQFADVDFTGHIHGPDHPARQKALRVIDRRIESLWESFGGAGAWMVYGDHGMVEVHDAIDVRGIVEQHARHRGVRFPQDYLAFYDSTIARFQARTGKGRAFLDFLPSLSELAAVGCFIDQQEALRRGMADPSAGYGDLMWWIDPGWVIQPCYFQDGQERVRGMHGYADKCMDMHSLALLTAPSVSSGDVDEASLMDICPTVCDLLQLPYPGRCQGRSLIKRGVA